MFSPITKEQADILTTQDVELPVSTYDDCGVTPTIRYFLDVKLTQDLGKYKEGQVVDYLVYNKISNVLYIEHEGNSSHFLYS